MELKEAERVVISKPVPSRPICSNFRSFSGLLACAINPSPSNAVTAIRPKTVRFKPILNHVMISSHAEVSGAAVCYPSDKALNSDSKSNVVYKPLAKVVSKSTLSLLANLGNSKISHQQALAQVEARIQPSTQFFPSQSEKEKTNAPSKTVSENLEDDRKSLPLANIGDRSSYDGYNWRKYGQKQVKGSEYPRSYYKCTHPNCPVKKKVERSLDGQIAEIVYKGEHNHSKLQPIRRNQETSNLSLSNQTNDRNEGSEARTENVNGGGLLLSHSTYLGKVVLSDDFVTKGANNNDVGTPENSCGISGGCEEPEVEEPRSKKRKNDNEPGISREGVQEPGVVVQNSVDSEIIGDGFRWRKYGQKVVKGNPYPRSYYRCTNLKCNMRKHVERASDDPKAFITTYEGRHNHDTPIKNWNPAASEPRSQQAATSKG